MEDSPAIYEMVCCIQDELIQTILDEHPDEFVQTGDGDVILEFENAKDLENACELAQASYKRSFDSEEHVCEICSRSLLGEKFTFLSTCEHYFCNECLKEMIVGQIDSGKFGQIKCADSSCGKSLIDHDIKRVGLDRSIMERYEQYSLQSAIEAMDDMTWCPLTACGSVAVIDVEDNTGRCQHCEHHFCLDCKQHVHPYKRCLIHRIDLIAEYRDLMAEITETNKLNEAKLNELYMKHCCKRCPNGKCGVRITLVSGGCSQV